MDYAFNMSAAINFMLYLCILVVTIYVLLGFILEASVRTYRIRQETISLARDILCINAMNIGFSFGLNLRSTEIFESEELGLNIMILVLLVPTMIYLIG